MVLGGEHLVLGGRWFVQDSRPLMDGISALIKETQERPLTPSALWEHNEKITQSPSVLAPWSWTSQS